MSSMTAQYIAGFFDGEGCVRPHMQKTKREGKGGVICVGVIFHISQKDPTVLRQIRDFFGFGCVRSANRNSVYRYRLSARNEQAKFIRTIYPYSIVKRDQLELAYEVLKTMGTRTTRHAIPQSARDYREVVAEKWLLGEPLVSTAEQIIDIQRFTSRNKSSYSPLDC